MTKTSKLPELPNTTTTQLVALKGSCPEEFYALVKALRLKGWPLRAIATPLSVSRTSVQSWEARYRTETLLPPNVPDLPKVEVKDRTTNTPAYRLTPEESNNLKELASLAALVSRYTDTNAPSRLAAAELEALLLHYNSVGVSKKKLAAHCDVSDSSIKQRLRKYS